MPQRLTCVEEGPGATINNGDSIAVAVRFIGGDNDLFRVKVPRSV